MQDGFVPIPRSLYEHEVFDYDDLWKTITWCWRKANFEAGAFRGVAVPVGSFVTGRATGSDELRCTPSSWYRRMQRLQSMLLIRMEANSEWTMVSVCGYPGCVDASGCSRAAFEQQTSSDRTANEQRLDTIKEFNKPRNYLSSKDSNSCTEQPRTAASVPVTPFVFPVSGKAKEWALPVELHGQLAEWFPGVDRDREIRVALAWCTTNVAKRKTAKGMPAFLQSWFGRAQDRPGAAANSGSTSGPATNAMAQPTGWWKPASPQPAPRFSSEDIETAEAFLQKARSQPYHDGSRRCDVDSLAIWRWTWRRLQNDRNPGLRLQQLHMNLEQLAAGRAPFDGDKVTAADRTFAEGVVDAAAVTPCRSESISSSQTAPVGSKGAA